MTTSREMGRFPVALVVDDHTEIRNMLALVLASAGYAVRCAENGAKALAAVILEQPDVILLDARMPVMDGWQFIHAYRALPGMKARLVLMSAEFGLEVSSARALADAYVPKPFNVHELLNALEGQPASAAPDMPRTH